MHLTRRSVILSLSMIFSLGLSAAQALVPLQAGPNRLSGVLEWDAEQGVVLVLDKDTRSAQRISVVATWSHASALEKAARKGAMVTIEGQVSGAHPHYLLSPDDVQMGSRSAAKTDEVETAPARAADQGVLDVCREWYASRSRRDGSRVTFQIRSRRGTVVKVLMSKSSVLRPEQVHTTLLSVDMESRSVSVLPS